MSDSNAMLLCADIESSPLIEEMNKLNNASSKSSIALHIGDRSHQRGKSNKDEERHHCGQKGHLKHDCYKWKKEKGKGKNMDDNKEEMKDTQPRKRLEQCLKFKR